MSNRVYYTGDMANNPGWFVASGDMDDPNAQVSLAEEPGDFSEDRKFVVFRRYIGDRHFGHCNPRFVTEAAYVAYQDRYNPR